MDRKGAHVKGLQIILLSLLVQGVAARGVRGESIDWKWTPAASGSGVANVYDGGPPLSQAGSISGPHPSFLIGKSDFTQPGSLGAYATFSARSQILEFDQERFRIQTSLSAGYSPSGFPGGDNPGGMAEAMLSTTVQFVMPADGDRWAYQLLIDERAPFFNGATSVLVENVTQFETMLSLTSQVFATQLDLHAVAGDVIRISTFMEGMGDMGPGSLKFYESRLGMSFSIPEPSTTLLLGVGALLVLRRRH